MEFYPEDVKRKQPIKEFKNWIKENLCSWKDNEKIRELKNSRI